MKCLLPMLIFHSVIAYDWNALDLDIPLNVNEKCGNDTENWLKSLKLMTEVTVECLVTRRNCTRKEGKVLEDNFWALEQLDAFGKLPSSGLFEIPLIFDGSYQECQRISGKKYETNYCYLVLVPGKNARCSRSASSVIRSATCMSSSCTPDDLPTLFNSVPLLPFTACQAFCSDFNVPKTPAFWAFTGFLGVMTVIVLGASVIDYLELKNDNLGLKMLLTFSLWENAGVISSVKEQKPGFIKCLDCIRFMSMLWVVTGHAFTFLVPPDTIRSMSHFMDHPLNHLILNAFFSVDTFFLLSGIVVSYLFFKTRLKIAQIKSPMTWILYYIHRYLRLTPPYMIFIGFFVVYGGYIQGPFSASQFNTLLPGVQICQDNWWRNLLYINNMGGPETACYGPSWYLAVDTQLYIFAPIFLIALYFSFATGTALLMAATVGSVITVYILYSVNDLPADFFGNGDTSLLYSLIYHKPWIRCPPYLLGLLVGYGLARNPKRNIHPIIQVTGWMIAFGLMVTCLFVTFDYDKGAYWSVFIRASYYNFSRLVWSLAVSWVIIANHMGWGGPIDAFMSHPMWQPFGRLSYCAYIVHFMTLFWFLNVSDVSMHYYSTFQIFIYYAVPACILSYIFAFFWSSMFEIPFIKLEKMLIETFIMTKRHSEPEEEVGSTERLIRL